MKRPMGLSYSKVINESAFKNSKGVISVNFGEEHEKNYYPTVVGDFYQQPDQQRRIRSYRGYDHLQNQVTNQKTIIKQNKANAKAAADKDFKGFGQRQGESKKVKKSWTNRKQNQKDTAIQRQNYLLAQQDQTK